jgi:hypothetical protein
MNARCGIAASFYEGYTGETVSCLFSVRKYKDSVEAYIYSLSGQYQDWAHTYMQHCRSRVVEVEKVNQALQDRHHGLLAENTLLIMGLDKTGT